MSNQQLVESKGICHGLPVYPFSLKGLTAIITGANGISGNYMLRVLAQDPERWTKIYCLSRRPPSIPDGLPQNAEHIPLDFLKEPAEIAKVLKEKSVKADYVFFYSYVQVKPKEGGGLWSDAEEMCKVNSTIRPSSINRHAANKSQPHSLKTSVKLSPSPTSNQNASCSKLARRTMGSTSAHHASPKKKQHRESL
jgi:hypothetical protein